MAKLKLDLHPIYNDSQRIETALAGIFREAEEKRIGEVEIIPGKGSGALKKTVLRFLDRPEVKGRYHRVVKDGDNWGRLFVYFRWPNQVNRSEASSPHRSTYSCFCCGASNLVDLEEMEGNSSRVECPACGSPNLVQVRKSRGETRLEAQSGY